MGWSLSRGLPLPECMVAGRWENELKVYDRQRLSNFPHHGRNTYARPGLYLGCASIALGWIPENSQTRTRLMRTGGDLVVWWFRWGRHRLTVSMPLNANTAAAYLARPICVAGVPKSISSSSIPII